MIKKKKLRKRRKSKTKEEVKPNNILEIERRMQMLRWRKSQNTAKIRSTLLKTKALQEQDKMARLVTNRNEQKKDWMQYIIQDEIQKPLFLDDDTIDNMVQVKI